MGVPCAPVAERIRHLTSNQEIAGSIPVGRTRKERMCRKRPMWIYHYDVPGCEEWQVYHVGETDMLAAFATGKKAADYIDEHGSNIGRTDKTPIEPVAC